MARILILAPRTRLEPLTDVLQAAGIVQVESAPSLDMEALAGEPALQERQTKLSDLREEIRAASALLPQHEGPHHQLPFGPVELSTPGWPLEPTETEVRRVVARIHTLCRLRTEHQEERAVIERGRRVIEAVVPWLDRLCSLPDVDAVALLLHRGPPDPLPLLREGLASLVGAALEVIVVDSDADSITVLLLVPRSGSANVRALLLEQDLGELPLPAAFSSSPLHECIPGLLRRYAELSTLLAGIETELTQIAAVEGPRLRAWAGVLDETLEQLRNAASFGHTARTVFIRGWTPAVEVEALRILLADRFGKDVVIIELPIGRADLPRVPVCLRNGSLVRPFEILLSILPPPRYGSVDPTPILAVCVPLFFGLILGDAAYGLAALVLASCLRRYVSGLADASYMLAAGGLAAVCFGLIFGEFLGEFGYQHVGFPVPWIDRRVSMPLLLGASVGLGVAHLMLGLILGTVAGLREGDTGRAIEHGLLCVLLLLLLSALVASQYAVGRTALTVLLVSALTTTLALLWMKGLRIAVEIMSVLSHILSYARLMAFAVSSAYLSLVANAMARWAPSVAGGILLGLWFHALAWVVGIVDPAIQALRLHYVEFFGTFYQPGGRRFTPFRRIA